MTGELSVMLRQRYTEPLRQMIYDMFEVEVGQRLSIQEVI